MGWKPTRHGFGLSKLSSSPLSTVCFLHNNAFFNYFTLVLFPGAHVRSVPMGRELILLTKSSWGCRARLAGRVAFPAFAATWHSGPCMSWASGAAPRGWASSKTQGILIHKRLHKKNLMLTLTRSFSNQGIDSKSGWVLWAPALLPWSTQGVCAASHCCVTATCAHRTYFVNKWTSW